MTNTKKSTTKAKRKPSAYNNFVKDKMKNRGNKAVTVMMKSIGAEWRKLSDAEKKKWA
jgi:hypothetical protein